MFTSSTSICPGTRSQWPPTSPPWRTWTRWCFTQTRSRHLGKSLLHRQCHVDCHHVIIIILSSSSCHWWRCAGEKDRQCTKHLLAISWPEDDGWCKMMQKHFLTILLSTKKQTIPGCNHPSGTPCIAHKTLTRDDYYGGCSRTSKV